MKMFIFLVLVIIIYFTSCSSKVKPIELETSTFFTNSFGPVITFMDSTNSTFHFSTFTAEEGFNQLEVHSLKDSFNIGGNSDRGLHSFYVPRVGNLLNYKIKSEDPTLDKTSGKIFFPDNLPFLIAVCGDFNGNIEVSKRILESIVNKSPALFIQLGNITSNTKQKVELGNFFVQNKILFSSTLFAPVYGDKDINLEEWKRLFGLYGKNSYYTVTLPDTRLFVLDSGNIASDSSQYIWLTNELEKSWNLWKIVAMHRPLYSSSKNCRDERIKEIQKLLEPIFEKYRVNLVLSGYDHLYERYEKNRVVYIISGGGGAPFDAIVMSNDYRLAAAEKLQHYVLLKIGKRRIYGVACSIDRILGRKESLSFKVSSHDVEKHWGDSEKLNADSSEISRDNLALDTLVTDTMVLDAFEIIE